MCKPVLFDVVAVFFSKPQQCSQVSRSHVCPFNWLLLVDALVSSDIFRLIFSIRDRFARYFLCRRSIKIDSFENSTGFDSVFNKNWREKY